MELFLISYCFEHNIVHHYKLIKADSYEKAKEELEYFYSNKILTNIQNATL